MQKSKLILPFGSAGLGGTAEQDPTLLSKLCSLSSWQATGFGMRTVPPRGQSIDPSSGWRDGSFGVSPSSRPPARPAYYPSWPAVHHPRSVRKAPTSTPGTCSAPVPSGPHPAGTLPPAARSAAGSTPALTPAERPLAPAGRGVPKVGAREGHESSAPDRGHQPAAVFVPSPEHIW